MARHAFDDLGYRRLEWKCDALTMRRVAPPSGSDSLRGVFRQHLVVKGHNRDTAWFSILDGNGLRFGPPSKPASSRELRRYRQPRRSLAEIRASLVGG